MSKDTLVVGDCHGHLDRLESLLLQEGVIGPCGMCGGSGDVGIAEQMEFCPACHGVGTARLSRDTEVIQLGDLGHFGLDSLTADSMIYHFASGWVDKVLWGNHDRAVIDDGHAFAGYATPLPETKHRMQLMQHDGLLTLAYEAHGFLLTHAGLHKAFKHNKLPSMLDRDNPAVIAHYFQSLDQHWVEDKPLPPPTTDEEVQSFIAIRDAISHKRGGRSPYGGILWRDASESLYEGFRQVFGHTAKDSPRTYQTAAGDSYCIDIGSQHNGKLAGIWLPEERIVEVQCVANDDHGQRLAV